jgi:4-amino-4-deoxy-L-arabinose transferase-like glycosyltransferase
VLLLTVIGSAAVRLRLLSMPLERDEGEYALAGQLILQGHPPYEGLYNMKWPGTYYSYAIIEAIFGQSIDGIRLGLLAVNAAAIVLVYLLGRRLLDEWGGAAAAVAYALLSVSPATLGFAGHATHFVVLAALAAVLFLLTGFERQRSSFFFIAGIFAGLAPIMKQPGIVFTAFVIVYWAWRVFRPDGRDRARRLENGALLGAGIVLPLVVMVASLLATHVMETFWVWTVDYARYYGAFQSDHWLTDVVSSFLTQWAGVIRPDFFFWVLAGLGLLLLPLSPRSRPAAAMLLGLMTFSFIGVFPGFVFRKHYFILVLPTVALLFGTVVFVFRSRVQPRFPRTARIGTAALILIPLLTSVWEQRAFYFSMTPQAIVANIYAGHPFAVCLPIADYIRTHSQPGDSIAILGSEPEIYFYARRLPATSICIA